MLEGGTRYEAHPYRVIRIRRLRCPKGRRTNALRPCIHQEDGVQHSEGEFRGLKDYRIYHQCWLPDGTMRAVLLVAHGYAEHSGRYDNLVRYFMPRGYAIYALDHRGHGRSDGER